MRIFLKTRRFFLLVGLSILSAHLLLWSAPYAYAFPSLNLGLDTAVTYLLGPLLGCFVAAVSNSTAPQMEFLATRRLRTHRSFTLLGLSVFQLSLVYILTFANNALFGTGIPAKTRNQILIATLCFQGLGMLSASLFYSSKVWILPLSALTILVLFGYASNSTPYGWNVLLVHSPATITLSAALFIAGLSTTQFLRLGQFERRH